MSSDAGVSFGHALVLDEAAVKIERVGDHRQLIDAVRA